MIMKAVFVAASIRSPCESISFRFTFSRFKQSTMWRKRQKKAVAIVTRGIVALKKMQIARTVRVCA